MIPTQLVVHPGGELRIGEGSVLSYGVSIEARRLVTLGARCMLAAMVRIADEEAGRRGPVHVGNDVWIAHGAILAPGVRIGDGAVVAAGAFVDADVPPRSLASGNPARAVPLRLIGPTSTEP
jgi:maltose O-acetyltransferase